MFIFRTEPYRDLLSLVCLVDLYLTGCGRRQGLERQVGSRLPQLPVAHVKGHDLVALPSGHSAGTRRAVVSAPAIPLSGVDLEITLRAFVKQKRARLLVLVSPMTKNTSSV